MGIFSSPTSYLGIDIGTSSIKMVELENYKNQARLKTYGYADISTNILRSNIEKNNQIIANHIIDLASKSNVQSKQVVAALPTFSVFNFIISIAPIPKKDLPAAIKWEAKKYIPIPIEDMILDWKILNKKEVGNKKEKDQDFKKEEVKTVKEDKVEEKIGVAPNEEQAEQKRAEEVVKSKSVDNNYRILLTAAPKNLVARYIDIFKKTKMNLLSLETEAFALSRALIGNDPSNVLIVDIGANTADICVIEQGVPVLNRGIDTGGESITKNIMTSMNVNRERAEQFKRDFGLSSLGQKNVPDVIQKSLDSIVNEIKYVFELYQRQGTAKIDKIVLTGGSSFLPNLPEYLSDLLHIPVIIGDPWDRIIYPLDLKPVLQEIGPRMGAAIGLAMRDI